MNSKDSSISKREKEKREKEQRENEQRRIFLEGLERYNRRGIPIYIDGKECSPEEFSKIFEVKEAGSFYMGDYIEAPTGQLKEIHFDKVYYK